MLIGADATLALSIFNVNFYMSSCLNILYNESKYTIRSNIEIVIMLDCKNLCAKIGFSNIIYSFSSPIIGGNSFF